MDGMAPDAKITFFDIGMVGSDYLKIPDVEDIFDMAYETGRATTTMMMTMSTTR